MTKRLCTACNSRFSKDEFYKNQWKKKSGRLCKPCHSEFYGITSKPAMQQHAGAEANKQKSNAQKKERKQRKRVKEREEAEARAKAQEAVRLARKRAREHKEANGESKFVKIRLPSGLVYAPIGMSEDEVKWRQSHSNKWPPPLCHPDEALPSSALEPHSTFKVTSGALRFGPADLLQSLDTAALDSSASVAAASYKDIGPTFVLANVSALSYPSLERKADCYFRAYNGEWLVYKLEKRVAPSVPPEFYSKTGEHVKAAWFVCHNAVCPLMEARRLLYHGYFGDELIKLDGTYYSEYEKPIDYHRFDYSGRKWKVVNLQEESGHKDGYIVGDSWCGQDSIEMTTDGASRDQACIVGFARSDAAKSFLLFDNNCDMEQTYFPKTELPIYYMPWTKPAEAAPDKNDGRFFILSDPLSTCEGYERSKHRIIFDVHGEAFATRQVYGITNSAVENDSTERERKRLRTITSFFGPSSRGHISRAGMLAILPSDVINPHLLKFLNVRDCLPLVSTCKYLKNILDPYEHGYIFDLQAYAYDDDIIPESLRCPKSGDLSQEIQDYVEEQDQFLVRKAAGSDAVVRSFFKNEVMLRQYGPDDVNRGDAHALVRRMVKNLIRHDRVVSLEHIVSLGRFSNEEFYFAIRYEATKSFHMLRRKLKADEWAQKCTKCNDDFGAFFCRRNGAVWGKCVQHDETKEVEDEYLCKGCTMSGKWPKDRYCKLCDRYECSDCPRHRMGYSGNEESDITYSECHQCKRNVCFARRKGSRPFSCSLQCERCNIVICRDCSKTQWYHCSKCYNSDSGHIRPLCNDCSKRGCWGDPEADRPHGIEALFPHYFSSAEVVEYSDSEEESEESDGGGEDYSANYSGCHTCGDDCFNGLGFRNPWCMGRYY